MLCLTDSLSFHVCVVLYLHIFQKTKTSEFTEVIRYYLKLFPITLTVTFTALSWMRSVIWPEDNMETQVELLKGTDSLKTAHSKWSCPKRCSNNMGISFRSWVYPSRVTSISMSSWLEDCLLTHTKWIGALLFGGFRFLFSASHLSLSQKN